jgi:hypothetical protein
VTVSSTCEEKPMACVNVFNVYFTLPTAKKRDIHSVAASPHRTCTWGGSCVPEIRVVVKVIVALTTTQIPATHNLSVAIRSWCTTGRDWLTRTVRLDSCDAPQDDEFVAVRILSKLTTRKTRVLVVDDRLRVSIPNTLCTSKLITTNEVTVAIVGIVTTTWM